MRMYKFIYIGFLFFLGYSPLFSQINQVEESINQNLKLITISGTVQGKESNEAISGVTVYTNNGAYATTNPLGEYKIKVVLGDVLIFESPEFETIRHTVTTNEDIDVLVEGYSKSSSARSKSKRLRDDKIAIHHAYIDSANSYKKTDIQKSIEYVTESIDQIGPKGNKKEFALSLSTLGEVYQYDKQFDLAITYYKDAQEANKTSATALLLGSAYIANKQYIEAENTLKPLLKIKKLNADQQVQLYEYIGDLNTGLKKVNRAVSFYEEGLLIANKNQNTSKIADLNSKIAEAYVTDDKLIEAEGYFNNSLELAEKVTPSRAIQEKEKVADFYNKKKRYNDEIELRKESLKELEVLQKPVTDLSKIKIKPDTITSQRINYKIGSAYVAQDKYEQAIPFLEKSIVEADIEDDLVVQKDATYKLSEVYEYTGKYTKALATYREYVSVVDTLYTRKEQEISRATRFNRELSKRQSRIAGLERERELQQSKYDLALVEQRLINESVSRQKWLIYSLVLGLLLLGLVTFFYYRSNQQQKLANNLLALKSLRTQMNPHFIFNALNSVNNYIAKSDERSANRYLSEFSTLMRAVLENSEEDFIPLSKELELLQLYVKLEHSRFSDKFDYEVKIDNLVDIASYQIPPMLLQPYIENAIWHGLRYKETKGFLKIEMTQKDKESIEIVVVDDGIGRAKSESLKTQNQKKQKSKGMGNIKKRVAILNEMYKDKVAINIADLNNDGSGTKVVFTLNKD